MYLHSHEYNFGNTYLSIVYNLYKLKVAISVYSAPLITPESMWHKPLSAV